MIEFQLDAFHRVIATLQHTQTSIEDKKSVQEQPDGGVVISPITDPIFLRFLTESAEDLKRTLPALGADITIKAVDDLLRGLKSHHLTYEKLKTGFADVQVTLNRELESASLLALTREERRLYAPSKPLFGDDFQTKFMDRGAFELDEAAKCLALGRPTAGAFHLMRVMEIAIQALARCLSIPDPTKPAERNWAIILRAIKDDGIYKRWPTAADRMHGEGFLFESLYASLDAAKNPWRNATMHVDTKYTDAEAEDIFAAVRGFIRKLSSRMDENGEPRV